ncbi:hypothetical protein [Vreelandella venusta]|uniref:hypothetical protein n=1 Tax=Vreelandella venusta TaxID=44935 RepID=UPI0018DA63B4|nr:hypothetical protein [Halomonas venusta]QPI65956.1 hypothetical protein IR195_09770 [Halomonas venusta]
MTQEQNNEWAVDRIELQSIGKRDKLTAAIRGPKDATLYVNPELPENYRSLTLTQLEELIMKEAKSLYPK